MCVAFGRDVFHATYDVMKIFLLGLFIVERGLIEHFLGCADNLLSNACADKPIFVCGHAEFT